MTMRKSYYTMRERLGKIGAGSEVSNLVAKQTVWLEKADANFISSGTKYSGGQYVAANYAEQLQTMIFNFFWGAMAVYEDKLQQGLITRSEYDASVRGIQAEVNARLGSLARSFDEDFGYFAQQDTSLRYSGTANTFYKSEGEGRRYPTTHESTRNIKNAVEQGRAAAAKQTAARTTAAKQTAARTTAAKQIATRKAGSRRRSHRARG